MWIKYAFFAVWVVMFVVFGMSKARQSRKAVQERHDRATASRQREERRNNAEKARQERETALRKELAENRKLVEQLLHAKVNKGILDQHAKRKFTNYREEDRRDNAPVPPALKGLIGQVLTGHSTGDEKRPPVVPKAAQAISPQTASTAPAEKPNYTKPITPEEPYHPIQMF